VQVHVSEANAAPRGGGRPAGILRGATGQPDAGHPWTPVKGKNWDCGEYFGWGFATFAHSSIYYFFKIFIFKVGPKSFFFYLFYPTDLKCNLRNLRASPVA